MFDALSNTRKQGDLGVAAAILYFTQLGWAVSKPMADSQRYDLIVDDGIKLYRVECKTTSYQPKGNAYMVRLATAGGNQSWNKVIKTISSKDSEIVFIVTSANQWYVVPTADIDGKSDMSLGDSAAHYQVNGPKYDRPRKVQRIPTGQSKKIIWPEINVVLDALRKTNYTQYGKMLGVTDNAVRKYVIAAGYDPKTLEKINKA